MNIVKAHNLACPMDGLPLSLSDRQYSCANGHSFDIARQGYINLLPVQHKRSINPGDSKEMIIARSEVLNSGIYSPIAEKFDGLVIDLAKNTHTGELCLLDAGCGEGYYLQHLLQALEQESITKSISVIGIDISKPAIITASKRSKQVTWLVASNKQPPVVNGTVDIIFCLFGFPVYESFLSVLKPEGKIILLDAGPEHLIELRELIYPEVNKSGPPDLGAANASGFSLSDEVTLTYKTASIPNRQVNKLLLMTPHFFRVTKQAQHMVNQLEAIELTIDVLFRVLERNQADKPG